MPNKLIHSTSPYLLQHAQNPVDWHPWNEETLQKARALDKMLLISIGYSTCHWCHVMERESFEDKEVAALMNAHFICIKVDREERPDVDMVYMNAVQLITGGGGWPLNCFALPDGRPFFGGTYFRKGQWKQLLENIALLYQTRRDDLEAQAEDLAQGIRTERLIRGDMPGNSLPQDSLREAAEKLVRQFDPIHGGLSGAPKFPMPVVLQFILDFILAEKDNEMTSQVNNEMTSQLHLTLRKMAFGGIYDQIGGGFARYSTDSRWHVPHFEKMLYDNAQLVSLYSRAFRASGDPLYREVVEETLEFIGREMTSHDGAFYTALDADSEGEEGKFYTWTEPEMRAALGKDAGLIMRYFNVGGKGLWEDGRNILVREMTSQEFAKSQGLQPSAFKPILQQARKKLLKARGARTRPGLDNKILTGWNAMMAEAYANAFLAFGKPEYLQSAIDNADYLLDHASRPDGGLFHNIAASDDTINGFLEDYAHVIQMLIRLYSASFDEKYLRKALSLSDYAIQHFHDPDTGMFYYTSDLDPALVARKIELHDGVIPSSNSVMARVLRHLGIAFEREDLVSISDRMLRAVLSSFKPQNSTLNTKHSTLNIAFQANWASLWLESAIGEKVMAVIGPDYMEKIGALRRLNFPGIIYFGSERPSELPYLESRFVEGQTLIYYCTGKECKMPVEDPAEVLRFFS